MGELKHLSTPRKRNQQRALRGPPGLRGVPEIPRVVASERGRAQTVGVHKPSGVAPAGLWAMAGPG